MRTHALLMVCLVPALAAHAEGRTPVTRLLPQLDAEVAAMAARVSPAVVEVEVSGFALAGEAKQEGAFVARQRVIGSGVLVSADGFLLTNQHVVKGAQRITVTLAPRPGRSPAEGRRRLPARVVGADPGVDLALLKVEATGLAFLPLEGAARARQGELVFAIGSPQGLASTITMGVVGSPARQLDFAGPLAYIQTDAPINPGNSGGPLVNVDGALVGINTFIVSQSGGSQGLGFAIPAEVVRIVHDALKADGRVHRTESGILTQAITPRLAAALGLPRDSGVVVSDVAPGGAAERAGVLVGDVVERLDGHLIDGLPAVSTASYLHRPGTPLELVLLRGSQRLVLEVDAPEARPPPDQLLDPTNPEQGLVRRLGIVGVDVSERLAAVLPPLRIRSGVVVAARTLDGTSLDTGLQAGDVIHAVNGAGLDSVAALRQALDGFAAGSPVVLQVERAGRLSFLAFDME